MHNNFFASFARPAVLRRPLLAAALGSSLLVACGGGGGGSSGGSTPAPVGPQSVQLAFAAAANGTAAGCGTPISHVGSAAVDAELRDLRFYVSHIELITAEGVARPLNLDAVAGWQLAGTGGVALVDLENATGGCAGTGTADMRSTVSGTVEAGTYTRVRFTVGVPAGLNHSDYAAASAPMDIQAMAWSWQSGRKFLKVEVNPAGGVARPAPAASASTFNIHMGSTGCTGNPASGEIVACSASNRFTVELPFQAATQKLVLDLDKLFEGSDVTVDAGGAVGCMSGKTDPECTAVFRALGLDLGTGAADPAATAVFRAEAR